MDIIATDFIYYLPVAIMPTAYNFIVNSPFKSMLSAAINVVPVMVMLIFLYFSLEKNHLKQREG